MRFSPRPRRHCWPGTRRLAARHWDYTSRRPGRPPTSATIRTPVIRIATENPAWGHRRVQGELIKPGHQIAASTVWQILHDAGIDPAPRRTEPAWKQFLTAQTRGTTRLTTGTPDTSPSPPSTGLSDFLTVPGVAPERDNAAGRCAVAVVFRGRCRIESTPDGRVAVKEEVFCVQAAGPFVAPATTGHPDLHSARTRGPRHVGRT